jgi:hypothetical protein
MVMTRLPEGLNVITPGSARSRCRCTEIVTASPRIFTSARWTPFLERTWSSTTATSLRHASQGAEPRPKKCPRMPLAISPLSALRCARPLEGLPGLSASMGVPAGRWNTGRALTVGSMGAGGCCLGAPELPAVGTVCTTIRDERCRCAGSAPCSTRVSDRACGSPRERYVFLRAQTSRAECRPRPMARVDRGGHA